MYQWERPVRKVGFVKAVKARIYNSLGKSFRKRISYFGAVVPQYRGYYEKNYNSHGRTFNLSYLDKGWRDWLSGVVEKDKDNKTLNIFVGVNASPLNKHKEILDSLTDLRYDNVRFYIPLYDLRGNGYKEYINEICLYAKLLYGDKAVCLTGPLNDKEYAELLAESDVVVTCADGFAVHGHMIYEAIMTALCSGKKVFLKASSLKNYLRFKNVTVYDADVISSMKFADFFDIKEPEFSQYLEQFKKNDTDFSTWRVMFSSLSKENEPVKFLHIIRPNEELATPMLRILNENFDLNEHRVLVNRRIPINQCEKLMTYPFVDLFLVGRNRFERFRYLYNRLNNAEHIIWHGFYAGYGNPLLAVKELIFLAIFPKFLRKTAWVGWGLDLHEWKAELTGPFFKRITTRIFNWLSGWERRQIPYFVSVFLPDGDEFRNQFGDKAKVFDGTYSNPDFIKNFESIAPVNKKDGAPFNIMVGHSANEWNHHIEALNSLAKFRYENIRIYIPLSTGIDRNYANYVCDYAKKLFGKKAICIFKKMSLQNYIRFLGAMDAAVFRVERQAALGNLMNLMYMGKKIYLPAGTVMHDFLKGQGVAVLDSLTIDDMTFAEFSEELPDRNPPSYVLERTDYGKNVEKWRYIFDEIDKKN